jgi:tRNA-Thr(GGU) m(6)t(6)A37 methyltransferase TsaA
MSTKRWFRVQSIGTVLRPGATVTDSTEFYDPWQETVLRVDERWAEGLDGIEAFSHLVVLFYLDRADRPRTPPPARAAEGQDGARPVGLFATRTPRRPNPIGIACPRLIRREGNDLVVSGIDAWPETPILDIKGYYPRDEMRSEATVPDWLQALWDKHDRERG